MIQTIDFLQLDLPAILVACLAALVCGLLGNFLVLRRQSLMGDAISHVVLPGIVAGFLVSGTTATTPMLIGAACAAIVAVALIELVRRLGRLEAGAAMGVVFTAMFALGVLLLEQTEARNVHIDVQHALYGNIEGTVWLAATGWGDLLDPAKLWAMPASVHRLFWTTLITLGLILFFFKELKLATFDAGLADALGFRPGWLGAGLIFMTALAAVAAFDAVGSILVIAMFICPAATARMLTDSLARQIALSALVAVLSGIIGYGAAAFLPLWLGFETALSAAGMVAVTAGLFQAAAMVFAPRHGWLARRRRRPHHLPAPEATV